MKLIFSLFNLRSQKKRDKKFIYLGESPFQAKLTYLKKMKQEKIKTEIQVTSIPNDFSLILIKFFRSATPEKFYTFENAKELFKEY